MVNQSIRSLEKMAKRFEETRAAGNNIIAGIDDLGEDLLCNVLSRLPAFTFASAAGVSRLWNSLCKRVLCSPKLSSAISFNTSLENAVNEVVEKVLSQPIQPHFALASVGPSFGLALAHQLIAEKIGYRIPLITNVSEGVIGKDMRTNEFVEVQWEVTDDEDGDEEDNCVALPKENVNTGLILTVGFLPGIKAHVVPLLSQDAGCTRTQEPEALLVDEFVMDIRRYVSAVSDSKSPAGIMLFANRNTDMKPVLQKMEFSFSPDTAIVGAASSRFLYKNTSISTRGPSAVAVALLFAKNKNKPSGIGETNFHVMLSTGLSPVGLTYKASSVKCYPTSTCLTASRESLHEHLDGQTILDEVYDELGDRIQYPSFYIGVTKRRKCTVGKEKVRRMQFLEFHEVAGGNEEYLFVESAGIKTGDPFQFYISNSKAAISSCKRISDKLECLKQESGEGVSPIGKREVFGGIIFSCCGRGDSFFGQPGIDSSPFLDNFPGVTFGGTYCAGEVGRGNLSLYDPGNEEGGSISCSEHFYSAVYLVMSYSPPPSRHL